MKRLGLAGALSLVLVGLGSADGLEVVSVSAGDGAVGPARFTRWTPLRRSTLAREEVAAARIGRFIYVVGAFTRLNSPDQSAARVLERYDIRRNRWRRMRSMPVSLNHGAAVAYKGKLYVHGGWPSQPEFFTSAGLYRFNPTRNRWKRLPSSPTPRAAEAAAVIGHRMYVAGGANDTGSLRSLEIYNFRTNRWRRAPNFEGPARNHARGVASGGSFYVLAGRKGHQLRADPSPAVSYRAVDRYDPRRHRWRRMPPMRRARSGFGAVTVRDGRIVVFGGEDWPNDVPGAGVIGSVEIFNPRTKRWGRLPRMRTPRHAPAGAALGNRIYAAEGSTKPRAQGPTRVLEVLDVRPR